VAGQYLVKGQETYFEGRLETRKYTGKDGQERRVTEIVVENMQMGSKPRGASFNSSPNQPAASQNQDTKEEEIPTINLDEEQEEVKIEDVPF
jgi:single-strand DNA-binding protein